MTPRVLVDATALPRDRGGVGRYVLGVISALRGDIVIVCQERDTAIFAELAPRARIVPIPRRWRSAALRLIWEQFRLPAIARSVGADVVHSPHYTMPVLSSCPVVVTFHDATFFSDPEVHTRFKRVFFRNWMRISARRAAAVIVPSHATESELRRYLAMGSTSVIVAHHGVDSRAFHQPSDAEIAEVRALLRTDRWIAFLGTLEPRKNLPALVAAYTALAAETDDPDFPTLALAGGAGWDKELDEAQSRVHSPGRLVHPGFIPDRLLPAFLGASRLMVYPSLGEGFGLPVLEAMASSAAVLTTRRLALPEVGGDAVAYSEPDAESLEKAIRALLHDDHRRADLRRRGLVRATEFTWAASARQHLEAYRRAEHHV